MQLSQGLHVVDGELNTSFYFEVAEVSAINAHHTATHLGAPETGGVCLRLTPDTPEQESQTQSLLGMASLARTRKQLI